MTQINISMHKVLILNSKCYKALKNSLIIQEENTKKNHKRVVSLYVIKNHVNLQKALVVVFYQI